MSKFIRQWSLSVQGRSGDTHVFGSPQTIQFEVSKRAMSGVNTGHFALENVSQSVRQDIEYDIAIDGVQGSAQAQRLFSFSAGYVSEGFLPVVFSGTIKKAFSYRDGTNTLLDLSVLDGGYAVLNAQVQRARVAPWNAGDEIAAIAGTMNQYGVTLGAVGSLFSSSIGGKRAVFWLGSSWDALKKFARANGGSAIIDGGRLYLLADHDCLAIPGAIPQLDATTGLLGTPRRSGWGVDAQMIFEPRLQLMQQLSIASTVSPWINGTYKVMGLSHRGMISDARDGGASTGVSLWGPPPPQGLNVVTPL